MIILFVPVRYKGDASYYEKKLSGHVRIKWLFGILSILADYDMPELSYSARVCGFKLLEAPSEDDKRKNKDRKRKTDDKNASEKKEKAKKKFFGRKHTKKELNGLSRWERFWTKLSYVWEDVTGIKRIWEKDSTRNTINLVFASTVELLKMIRPRKLMLKARFGTGEAYSLGQILIAVSFLYGMYGEHIDVEPDWDNAVLEGEIKLSGRILIFTLLKIFVKVYFSKDARRLKRNIDRFMASAGDNA